MQGLAAFASMRQHSCCGDMQEKRLGKIHLNFPQKQRVDAVLFSD